jgi:ferredoxin
MKIRLDRSSCQGHGLCHGVDPDLFPIDDEGFSTVQGADDVEPGDEQTVRGAVAACPEQAFSIEIG